MYKVLECTCWAIVLPIRSFVFSCPRCCRRRGLLKVPIIVTGYYRLDSFGKLFIAVYRTSCGSEAPWGAQDDHKWEDRTF